MQRILSVETSRSAGITSGEYITKRLCCSFILTVGFFCILGGFLLGRFVADRSQYKLKAELNEIAKRLHALDGKLRHTFHQIEGDNFANCSTHVSSRIKCGHLTGLNPAETTSQNTIKETLDLLNNCFNDE